MWLFHPNLYRPLQPARRIATFSSFFSGLSLGALLLGPPWLDTTLLCFGTSSFVQLCREERDQEEVVHLIAASFDVKLLNGRLLYCRLVHRLVKITIECPEQNSDASFTEI